MIGRPSFSKFERYTAQILDGWGEEIVNINERTFPSKPYGKFALIVKPGFRGAIPVEAARIVAHHSGEATSAPPPLDSQMVERDAMRPHLPPGKVKV
jgi:hypothetical protein